MAKASPDTPAVRTPLLEDRQARLMRKNLVAWYIASHRKLPWRQRPANAYHVMVSEAMLQQTQVATVIAYFRRFIDAFPTLEALAQADEQAVLAQWQGLGYYRRARLLHAAAKAVMAEHEGKLPASGEALLKLPGVGRYTAGAIASIAFDLPEPIVDGNVARVLARLTGMTDSIDEKEGQAKLWNLAQQLVSLAGRDMALPGDFNQAMMELGALVCTPAQPACLVCPLRKQCTALATGQVAALPVRTAKKKPVAVTHHVIAAANKQGQYLFVKRPATGLWSNMWQLPTLELQPASPSRKKAAYAAPAAVELDECDPASSLLTWLKQTQRLTCNAMTQLDSFTHQTTHRTITFTLWRAEGPVNAAASAKAGTPDSCWRKPDEATDLPMSNPQRRMVASLAKS